MPAREVFHFPTKSTKPRVFTVGTEAIRKFSFALILRVAAKAAPNASRTQNAAATAKELNWSNAVLWGSMQPLTLANHIG